MKYYAMKTYEGVHVQTHVSLFAALVERVCGQIHAPAALPPGVRAPDTHWIGGWVDPIAGMDDTKK
jgi:hypothetical protein